MMVTELYDALRAAGAPEGKARAAAQAMSEESLATKAETTPATAAPFIHFRTNSSRSSREISLLLKSFFG